ncbi:hypothetical protein RND71_029316 [Anisodus tanguticus]|uniref:Uncharacterized protein n=1 Tax=Anisodus tanguticus TaxID=243964 RepID=A0AAE1UYM7_9SOLA|nr:hypothetical protein RND71_029316 [Anisodus tanguticus]
MSSSPLRLNSPKILRSPRSHRRLRRRSAPFPYWDEFVASCLAFQNEVSVKDNDAVRTLLAEKELLQNEIHSLNKKNKALESSTEAFVEEVLEDLHQAKSALDVEIRCGNIENEKLLNDIDELKGTLSSVMLTSLQQMVIFLCFSFNISFRAISDSSSFHTFSRYLELDRKKTNSQHVDILPMRFFCSRQLQSASSFKSMP